MADRHEPALEALRRSILESPGVSASEVRRAAYRGDELPEGLGPFVAKVRTDASRIIDEDIAALRSSGVTEDEIFELTLAAALGAATEMLQAGLRALGQADADAP